MVLAPHSLRAASRLSRPLHCPRHPPLGHQLCIDDGVLLLEGDLVTVCSSVVKLGYVVGATLDGRGRGRRRGGEGGE